jgi:hypothetical protein
MNSRQLTARERDQAVKLHRDGKISRKEFGKILIGRAFVRLGELHEYTISRVYGTRWVKRRLR